MPTWTPRPTFAELGIIGWFRARLGEAPVRPDRSVTLASERGGRLDRLDLWLLVVLVIATMVLRTFRLSEPYQMHFDEVYHARTAAEFLQDWRYGLSHDIYEWTHPHLAKYAMAAGIVLWGQDKVNATSDLGVPVRASVVEPRREVADAPGKHAGERLHVATGTEIRSYDLVTRKLVSIVPAAGSSAVAVDESTQQLVIGYDDGRIATLDLALMGDGGVDTGLEPVVVGQADHAIDHLLVTEDGTAAAAAAPDRLTVMKLGDGSIVGSMDLPDIAALAPGGTGQALVADIDAVTDKPSAAAKLAEILSGDATDYEDKLDAASPGTTVVLGSPGSGDERTALDKAIADETLPGVRVEDVARIAVADGDGVAFLDPTRMSVVANVDMDGGAHGLAHVTGVDDDKLYVTSGPPEDPGYEVVAIGGDAAKGGPVKDGGKHPLPAPGSWVAYDAASQQVHILGLAPNPDQAVRTGSAPDAWTVYVVEPHGNAVYADARLPDGFTPAAWASDIEPDYPSTDRQQLLLFAGDGGSASINLGYHAFAWRLPGVIAGAITAALLYLLARILFRRRLVAGLVGLFVLVDGMFFVQSRIGMNDVYVGLFIIAAYTVFAAIWTGWWRGRAAVWLGFPAIGLLLGLALASKWVAAYAIGALVLLILVRSALGRVLAILGLIGITSVLGYMAITVPEGQGFGNLTFLLIMVALTLVAVVVAILHPIAWTDDELRFAVAAPVVAGTIVFFGALARGSINTVITVGPLSFTPLLVAIALGLSSIAVAGLFWLGGRAGLGPLASPPVAGDPGRLLEPPAPPPDGWLRPGWLLGLPVVWVAACLVVVPLGVYIASYIPWAMIEGHQIVPGWPAGHTGQTLLDLTGQMYRYHNGLTAAHPASSPWWAWPMNLKPVWFYQEGLGAGTSAALYDAGSLVIWWLGIPAIAFVSWMAYRRRSLALTLIAVGFAAQWIPWARIDRAAFQYHYYTALPFVVMALAYFVAELWHGASRHTWALARIAAGVAIVGPAVMWILARPLCAVVDVLAVNPGSQACPAVIPDAVVTARTAALALAVGLGVLLLLRRFLEFERGDDGSARRGTITGYLWVAVTTVAVIAAMILASLLPETPLLNLTNVPVEPLAVIALIPLGYLALQVLAARDARRFVVGFLVAAIGWFAVLYPNISALPLPSAMVNAYQGILPTYLYAFQFPVSKVDRNTAVPIFTPSLLVLTVVLTVACLVVAYSARVWRLARAEIGSRQDSLGGHGRPRPERRRLRDGGPEIGRQRAGRREPADDEPVVVLDLGGHPRPAEGLGPLPAGGAHLGPEPGVVEQPADRQREFARVVGRHEQRLPVAPDHAFVAVDVGGDDRGAGGHRLEQNDAERFPASRRRGEDIDRPEELRLLGIGHPAKELDLLESARGDVAAGFALLRPRAHYQKAVAVAHLAQDAVGLEQVEQSLPLLVPADEEDIRRPVLPASDRDGVREAADIDPVRDDLVVTGEEAVDEVAGGRADRDPAVQTRRVAPHRSAAELVRRREPGIGMERRDVHAPRLAQQEQRQERHERFMEVQEVELLAREQRPDLADVPRREGQRPDRSIGRHAEPDADAQDVALRRALRTVAGGDDPDVVAVEPEVLVQELDVLRDTARFRIDVRADEADLHGADRLGAARAAAGSRSPGGRVASFAGS